MRSGNFIYFIHQVNGKNFLYSLKGFVIAFFLFHFLSISYQNKINSSFEGFIQNNEVVLLNNSSAQTLPLLFNFNEVKTNSIKQDLLFEDTLEENDNINYLVRIIPVVYTFDHIVFSEFFIEDSIFLIKHASLPFFILYQSWKIFNF